MEIISASLHKLSVQKGINLCVFFLLFSLFVGCACVCIFCLGWLITNERRNEIHMKFRNKHWMLAEEQKTKLTNNKFYELCSRNETCFFALLGWCSMVILDTNLLSACVIYLWFFVFVWWNIHKEKLDIQIMFWLDSSEQMRI